MTPSPQPPSTTLDWGIGEYEHTAAALLPCARVIVDEARIVPGEHVVDVGCGTGNAALLAAERGARVTGVDPAPRLLDVARAEAAARGLELSFVAGDAAGIPISDGDADVVLSVFGVIFAPDAGVAANELARVCADDGRIVLGAWRQVGVLSEMNRLFGAAVREALGPMAPPAAPPFAWHDRDALAGLFGPLGFEVTLTEHVHAFTAPSLDEYVATQVVHHPMSIAGRHVLERAGAANDVFERAIALLQEANEDPEGFRVTSPYVVATARRSG
jgi:SAM-dependent methyltransferase